MRVLTLLTVVFALVSTGANAQQCAPQDEGELLQSHRLLRQLALDLVGRVPTMDEYERLSAGASIEEEFIPEFLASDEYFDVVRQHHRALLWGSLGNIADLGAGAWRLRKMSAATGGMWRMGNMRSRYRGDRTVDCLDQLQTEFDELGRPVPIETFAAPSCADPDGAGPRERECRREGYVMVDPWWDLGNPVKVCAYDAQALAVGLNGHTCEQVNPDPYCGCGPNLRYCMGRSDQRGQAEIREALEEEPARIFEGIIRERRSYLEAFTTNETWVNGASSHYYRHQIGTAYLERGGQITHDPALGDVPTIPFAELDRWERVQRDDDHAGVLTSTGYLLRFASNRARANRFFTAFRCEPFVPPAGGLPEETERNPHPNLRERTGCRSCHERLEPLAAVWGRWRDGGTNGLLSHDFLDIDNPNETCIGCGGTNPDGTSQRNCAALCNSYFVTTSNSDARTVAEWGGLPLARAWLNATEAGVIDEGPASLIDESSEVARVAECTVRTLSQRLLGRELTSDESIMWAPALAAQFASDGYDYTALVARIVTGERYQTIR